MLDLIFLTFVFGVFYVGFKAGNAFKTLREFGAAVVSRIGAFFD